MFICLVFLYLHQFVWILWISPVFIKTLWEVRLRKKLLFVENLNVHSSLHDNHIVIAQIELMDLGRSGRGESPKH